MTFEKKIRKQSNTYHTCVNTRVIISDTKLKHYLSRLTQLKYRNKN